MTAKTEGGSSLQVVEQDGTPSPLAPAPAPGAPARAVAPMGFEPANLTQLYEVAKWLGSAGLVPESVRGKPSDIALVIWQGAELGLKPMQALNNIDVINGRTALRAALKVGMCQRETSICEFFEPVASTETEATYRAKRRGGKEVVFTFTKADAEMAGLWGKDNWKKNPKAMLRARAQGQLADMLFQDIVKGIPTAEDVGDLEPVPAAAEAATGASSQEKPVTLSRVDQMTEKVTGKKAKAKEPETVEAPKPSSSKPAAASQPPAESKPAEKPAPAATTLPALDALGKPLALMTFGPKKGTALIYLSGEELANARLNAELELEKSPKANWVPKVRQCLDDIVAEQTKRFERLQAENAEKAKPADQETKPADVIHFPPQEKKAEEKPAREPGSDDADPTDEDAPF